MAAIAERSHAATLTLQAALARPVSVTKPADLLRPSRRRTRSELLRGGTASIPVREKGQERRFAAGMSLSHVPSHRRLPPNCGAFRQQPRGSLLETDSPLEEEGFEPSVPVLR